MFWLSSTAISSESRSDPPSRETQPLCLPSAPLCVCAKHKCCHWFIHTEIWGEVKSHPGLSAASLPSSVSTVISTFNTRVASLCTCSKLWLHCCVLRLIYAKMQKRSKKKRLGPESSECKWEQLYPAVYLQHNGKTLRCAFSFRWNVEVSTKQGGVVINRFRVKLHHLALLSPWCHFLLIWYVRKEF